MMKQKYFIRSQWLKKYFKDRYVREVHKKKLRSRSWFKIDAINHMDLLFQMGMTVVDLGSAPGGWSLYAKKKVGNTGNVIACDILPMQKIDGVDFFQGDCLNSNFMKMFFTFIGHKKVQVVLSDMSPNITGISIIDNNRFVCLGDVTLNVCHEILIFGGTLLVKLFQGAEFERYLNSVRSYFNVVKIRKPNASKPCSREVYIVAKEYRI